MFLVIRKFIWRTIQDFSEEASFSFSGHALNYFDDALGLYNQLSYNFSYWPKISSYFAFLNQPSWIHCEQNGP